MNKSYNTFWNDLKSGKFASMVKESVKGKSVSTPIEVYNILKPLFEQKDDIEKVYFIFLDSKNNILAIENLFSGTIATSAIYPREIIKSAINLKANAFIMAHNHPSGDTSPSSEDKHITKKVGFAAASVDISFHDHIIIGDGYHSMADSGWLKEVSRQFKSIINQGDMCQETQVRTKDKINLTIMENELSRVDQELNPLAKDLYWFMDLFQATLFKDTPVPTPILTFEKARVNTLSHYVIGNNLLAVREQINLNRLHLNRPLWSILSILLHELVHVFEFTYIPENKRTKGWYHSKAFRTKMEEFGLYFSDNGCHIGLDPQGKFVLLLRQHGVSFDEIPGFNLNGSESCGIIPIDSKPKIKGRSKLKKWTCGCQIVRIGTQDFKGKCLICNNEFRLDE